MSAAARDRLTLGAVEARCQLVGAAADALPVRNRLERISREDLPRAIAEAIRGRLGSEGEVVRIDRIELDLVLTREAFESAAMPRLWGERIAAAVAAALARTGHPGVVRFPGDPEYVAAYLERRFEVVPHPAFAFVEFVALDHVSPSWAAAELLAARPGYLPALSRWGFGMRDPVWLARRIEATHCARILDALAPDPVTPGASAAGLVRELLAAAPPGWRALRPPAAALALVLASLAPSDGEGEPAFQQRATAARALAAFAHIADTAPELLDLLSVGELDGVEILPLVSMGRREAAFAQRFFSGRRGRRLAAVASAVLGVRPPGSVSAESPSPVKSKQPPRAQVVRLESPFAGLALLLPTMRALSLDLRLTPGQARAVVLAVLDPPPRNESQAEALVDLLLPFPIEPELPPLPPIRPEDGAGATPEEWAAHLLAEFAERLPGLKGSSAAYLRRQFLHIGGALELEPAWLTVRLVRPPLAIVLTIAGLVGELGSLPWRPAHRLRVLMP
ncbi:hypothetical protein ACMGDH_01660 [Sphingomonas sp. DT-207]|uniref:hypothetical protein n=1 Tax=Sphingomonas sp. DT-207 TaxID=3396167 RepID=UPI003F1AF9F1